MDFIVELEQNKNNKDIYTIELLYGSKVVIELKCHCQEVPQCTRCQYLGHTKYYCTQNPRSIKCAGEHFTKDCSWKNPINIDVQCALCKL